MSRSLFTDAFLEGADNRFLPKQLANDTVCVEVDPGLVERLLTWQDLNEILATRPLQQPRVRLHQRGDAVPAETYTEIVDEPDGQRSIILPSALYRALRDGASLVVDAIDRLHPPIRDAADDLMQMVHERVQVNLYLLWGSTYGFGTHWDDHDTFIVQVAGTKHWTVHGPGRPHPMKTDVTQAHECPEGVAWEGVLRPGHILHVPRGWWHTVTGTGDVSAHLTFGFTRATGIDWAQSLIDRLYAEDAFRQDLPRFASDDAQAAHQRTLTEGLLAVVADSSFGDLLDELDARFPRRQTFSFPWVIDDTDPPPDAVVRFSALVQPRIDVQPDRVTVTIAGRRFSLAARAAPVLRYLALHRQASVRELALVAELTHSETCTVVRTLAREHIASITAPATP